MKSNCAIAFAVVALLLTSGCSKNSDAKKEKERQAVLQTYTQMKDAWNKGDIAALDAVFRPDAIFIDSQNPGNPEHWGTVRSSVQRSAEVLHPKLTDEGQPVVNTDGDSAWMAVKYHVSATTPQGQMEANGMLTLAMVRQEGRYRVVLFHSSRVP